MKIEIHKCDVCKKEGKVKETEMSVIFLTEQNEGRDTEPYLSKQKPELCEDCLKRVLGGEVLYGWGAMGYNHFHFIKYKED